jgi:hypothetical protein
MIKSWKNPDTDVVHVIAIEEGTTRRPDAAESALLHTWTVDEIVKRFFRRVTMACGEQVQLDSDEYILPHGEALLQSPPPILRPWLTGRDAPTCVACAATKPAEPMRNEWGSKLRGL